MMTRVTGILVLILHLSGFKAHSLIKGPLRVNSELYEVKDRYGEVETDVHSALRKKDSVKAIYLKSNQLERETNLISLLGEFKNLRYIGGKLPIRKKEEILTALKGCSKLEYLPFIDWKALPSCMADFTNLKYVEVHQEQLDYWKQNSSLYQNIRFAYLYMSDVPDWMKAQNRIKIFGWIVDDPDGDIEVFRLPNAPNAAFFITSSSRGITVKVPDKIDYNRLTITCEGSLQLVTESASIHSILGPRTLVLDTDGNVDTNVPFSEMRNTTSFYMEFPSTNVDFQEILSIPGLCSLSMQDEIYQRIFEVSNLYFVCPCGYLNCNLFLTTDTVPRVSRNLEFNYVSRYFKSFENLNQKERLIELSIDENDIDRIHSSVRVADSLALYVTFSSDDKHDYRELRKLGSLENLYSLDLKIYTNGKSIEYAKRIKRQIRRLRKKLPQTKINYELN